MNPSDDVSSATGDGSGLKLRARWYQFRLRTLLILTALCAAGAGAWRSYLEPYHQQRQTMALIERLRGNYKTVEADAWLRRLLGADLQNVVFVDLADCDDPGAYLQAIAALPKLETLVVGGPAFGDEHLSRLKPVSTLRALVLDGTSVTKQAVAALQAVHTQAEILRSERRTIRVLGELASMVDTVPSRAHGDLRGRVGEEHFHQCDRIFFLSTTCDANLTILHQLSSVRRLRLPPQTGDAGFAHVRGLTTLEGLDLFDSEISDAGIAPVEDLTHLQWLGLSFTQISDAGLRHLKKLSDLRTLDRRGTRVSAGGVADLQRALPDYQIMR